LHKTKRLLMLLTLVGDVPAVACKALAIAACRTLKFYAAMPALQLPLAGHLHSTQQRLAYNGRSHDD
jgi:hypothetical protein